MYFYRIQIPYFFVLNIALISGISAYYFKISSTIQWIIFTILIAAVLIKSESRVYIARSLRNLFILLLIFLWGFTSCKKKEYHRLCAVNKFQGNVISLTGTVENKEISCFPDISSILIIRAASITLPDKTIALQPNHFIKLNVRKPIDVQIGDTLHYKKIFWPIQTNVSKDYFQLRERLSAILYVTHTDYNILKKTNTFFSKILNFIYTTRMRIFQSLKIKINSASFSLFNTLFLGAPLEESHIATSVKDDFNVWGISHYLARSGLHVAIFLMMWKSLLRFLPIGLIITNILLLLIGGILWALSWTTISFIRALLSYVITQTTIMSDIQPHPLHIANFTAFIVLIANPFHLFFLSFQLSFGLTALLALLYEIKKQKKVSLT